MSSSRLPPSLMKAAVQATPLTTSAAVTSRTGAVLRRSSAAAAAVSQRATLPPAARFSTISQRQSLEQLRQRFSSIPGISQRQWQQLQQRVYSTELETKQEEQAKEERPHKVYDFEAVKKLAEAPDRKTIIVDVREPNELQETGRIPGAINIPIKSAPDSFHISDEEFEDRYGYPRPPRDAEVVFYCRAGVRCKAAADLAKDAGWTNTGEYPGSWLEWFEKGGKVQR